MTSVLIIDDQSVRRKMLTGIIRSIDQGIDVRTFADPLPACEWIRTHVCDLVITDHKMPHMDGLEFTRYLRGIPAYADIPVAVVIGTEDKSVRYEALKSGATDLLSEPIDHNEYGARCRNLLRLRNQQRVIADLSKWLEKEIGKKTPEPNKHPEETLIRSARSDKQVFDLTAYRCSGQGSSRPMRILVAEDNPTNQQVISEILEGAGYKVHLVSNGEQALDVLDAFDFDLAIIDMRMPVMDGIKAIKIYRFTHAEREQIPFIVLTKDATIDAARECEEAKASACLTKPFRAEQLLATIFAVSAESGRTDRRKSDPFAVKQIFALSDPTHRR